MHKGGLEAVRVFLSSTKLFIFAESLGAVECLMEHPGIMTHADRMYIIITNI